MAKFAVKLKIPRDFQKAVRRLGRADRLFTGRLVEDAKRRLAEATRVFLIAGIDTQRPEWLALHPVTKAIKGNDKKLIESGSFRASMKVWKEGKDWFAGLYPGSKGSEGQDLEIVGAVHEDGALVPISDPIRKFFAAKGFPLRGDTKFIFVPARPWFAPVVAEIEVFADTILDPLADEIMKGLV